MSFLKVFNSCCPFLIAPAMDTEDDMPEHSKTRDQRFDFELRDLADENNKRYQQQRLDKYARSKLQVVNSNVLTYKRECNKHMSSNNTLNDGNMMHENVSNMVVNDILNKIVY